jgi:hypothetical protein
MCSRNSIRSSNVLEDRDTEIAREALHWARLVGDLHIAAKGLGPDDGFTGYNPTASFGTRPRWGDYGGAATDGNAIWLASEYVNQTCTFDTFVATNFWCDNTRTQLANWGTRISKVVP